MDGVKVLACRHLASSLSLTHEVLAAASEASASGAEASVQAVGASAAVLAVAGAAEQWGFNPPLLQLPGDHVMDLLMGGALL